MSEKVLVMLRIRDRYKVQGSAMRYRGLYNVTNMDQFLADFMKHCDEEIRHDPLIQANLWRIDVTELCNILLGRFSHGDECDTKSARALMEDESLKKDVHVLKILLKYDPSYRINQPQVFLQELRHEHF